ncbi:MAG TPA: hypothetical protein VM618_10785, partial [Acidimicrobiia bacterium]|nr:hypothetical protein [Acidimicrobiia bacterium]
MRRRRFLGLVMIAMAVFITGVASLGVLEDDDEADGLAGVASCRTGPAAEGEPEWDELPGWTADALDAAVPDDATCRELSFAKTADEELASLHLRVEAPGGSVGIDAERLGGSVDE